MSAVAVYHVGDRIRITVESTVAPSGASGMISAITYNAEGLPTAFDILVDSNPPNLYGTTVFPHEIERAEEVTAAAPLS